ncbi:hypothetical protein OAS73_04195 [Luminiphilus sp.]|nr:hypothetical protein [Luminiphilus sp.]
MIRLTAFLLFLFSLPLLADTQVTHTFEDGEVIRAEEFNKNFDDLEAAIDAVGGGGVSPSDGVVYGSPVWVDSSGTVLTGRAGLEILWRVNGELKTIGQVQNGAYGVYVARYYTSFDCTGEAIGFRQQYGQLWVANGVLNEEGALVENAPQFNSIDYKPGGSCSVETGESTNVRRESSIGVAAPSWTTDGTQMFSDLR